jgi:hypothetical protein
MSETPYQSRPNFADENEKQLRIMSGIKNISIQPKPRKGLKVIEENRNF